MNLYLSSANDEFAACNSLIGSQFDSDASQDNPIFHTAVDKQPFIVWNGETHDFFLVAIKRSFQLRSFLLEAQHCIALDLPYAW
ncbi:hypothetical protein RT21_19300 [Pseudomonas sp. 10B238]|jgi:hypothetical protein|uniref:hypothetical protein n=1 Tax=Pseudomonadaceae TaxID=135621 RepID=UPI000617BB71|nr:MULTISPECIES: hypothetical protein [Pseudomonadaceae]MAL34646.1 hypothetical protein [Pseudomonas sp.]KJJ61618.1 hypothetical protein RT21_19300 [Pseudomonas sp. 10B238]MBK3795218.1 hypothetical protein [Stutzerimonas stutzeri]MBK3878429.1 hypothetical protein [Stutzerimonas stutzeri]HBM09602.1 hypothetical protein [Pseudomonas sp.]|tara:strand:+ start:9092 stop:9343 length:252 start_codon:yes stop_codon:yes gene_type:complete